MCAATVVLFGATGAGKTTTAQVLKEKYGWSCLDIDSSIEIEVGRSIAEIIRVEGEQYFRALEAKAIEDALKQAFDVISIGAGAVMTASVQECIERSAALPVLLDIGAEAAAERVLQDQLNGGQVRPMVAGDVVAGLDESEARQAAIRRIQDLARVRAEAYKQTARIRLITEFADAETIAGVVVALREVEKIGPQLLVSPQQLGAHGTSSVWVCEAGSNAEVFAVADRLEGKKHEGVFAIADSMIPDAILEKLIPIESAGKVLKVGSGEALKQLGEVERLSTTLLDSGANRAWTLLAIGGGVIGDLAGVVASLFQRGMDLVHVPTTLVAQVDSAIGGKTAVNLPAGKNQLGTFHPARAVVSNIGALESLPEREFRSGLAEVVKYATVFSEDFFSYLEQVIDKVLVKEPKVLFEIVGFCSLQKQRCIHNDLEDRLNVRALLNFGHTYGHAIEKLSGYGKLLHGEAVAVGMIQALKVSAELAEGAAEVSGVQHQDLERIARLLQRCLLPVAIPDGLLPKASSRSLGSREGLVEGTATSGIEPGTRQSGLRPSLADWSAALRTDKKRSGNEVNFVVLEKIGSAQIKRIPLERLVQRLEEAAL